MPKAEQLLFLLISSQGLLLSLALISAVFRKEYSKLLLGLITGVITLEILNAAVMPLGYRSMAQPFPFWILGSYLVLPAALYLFASINTVPGFRLKPLHVLLFVPAALEIIMEFASFYSNILAGTAYRLHRHPLWFAFTELLPLVAMVGVLLLYWRQLQTIAGRVEGLALQKQPSHLLKMYGMFGLFAGLTLLWFVQGIVGMQVFTVIVCLLCLFVFALGYVGFFQPSFFDLPNYLNTTVAGEDFSRYDDARELLRLQALFEQEKIFTRHRLSLEEVGHALQLPARYVSILINTFHECDFRSYVNGFRVKEVIALMSDPAHSHKSLLGIAMDAGFSSKSSFNQIFKSVTGKTPSAFGAK